MGERVVGSASQRHDDARELFDLDLLDGPPPAAARQLRLDERQPRPIMSGGIQRGFVVVRLCDNAESIQCAEHGDQRFSHLTRLNRDQNCRFRTLLSR
jgi:hypothetical protein